MVPLMVCDILSSYIAIVLYVEPQKIIIFSNIEHILSKFGG